MKVLNLCSAGIVRSGAFSRRLKERGIDSLQAGVHRNDPETLAHLFRWADRVVLMDSDYKHELPKSVKPKLVIADVGPDIWGTPDDPDLVARTRVMADAWEQDGYRAGAIYRLRPKS